MVPQRVTVRLQSGKETTRNGTRHTSPVRVIVAVECNTNLYTVCLCLSITMATGPSLTDEERNQTESHSAPGIDPSVAWRPGFPPGRSSSGR